jgi:hypothetical protein
MSEPPAGAPQPPPIPPQPYQTPLFPPALPPPTVSAPAPALPPEPAPAQKKPRRRIGWIIAVILLSLALIATGTILVLTYLRLEEAKDVIDEQTDLIDEKETFGDAMEDLLSKAGEFDGVKFGTLVPQDEFRLLAARGWNDRWDTAAMSRITADVRDATAELETMLANAAAEAGTNTSGTAYETVLDSLGGGYVLTSIDDADALCADDVLGCVMGDDPYVVHIDAADSQHPSMTDFIRSGVSYHEFAHVLQFTNPDETDVAVEAFGGDVETMADCFALTYLPGWKLDHTVWINDYQYYEVSVGYGYTCNEGQKQVIRDWYEGLGYRSEPVSQ